MKIQNPTITQITELTGDGANLTGSFSGSIDASSLQVTGVGGDLIPTTNNTFDLGSPTKTWRDLYLSSASLYINGSQVLSTDGTDLTIQTDAGESLKLLETGADTITLETVNGDITITTTGTGNIELDAPIQIAAGNNILSSDGNAISFANDISLGSNDLDAAVITTTGNVTIGGDLTVTGTTTELQVTNLNVEDKNITVASGSADSAAANGAGLTVDGANATLTYSSTGDQWQFNKKLDLGSNDFHAQDAEIDSLGVGTAASGTTGEIRATNDITAFYSSDERLKENIVTLDGALDKVKAMRGVTFDWKELSEEDRKTIHSHEGHDLGVIAQEVQAQYPELVHQRDHGYLSVDYVKLTAVLIEAVKELSAKVDELSK